MKWLESIHCQYSDIQYPCYVCICVLECILCLCHDLSPMQSAPVVVFYLRFWRWISLFVLFVCILVVFVWALELIFRTLEPGLQPQLDAPLFTRMKSTADWKCGLSVGHGYLSIAVFIIIYRSHPYRWAAVVPRSNQSILAIKPLGSYAYDRVRHCVELSEGLSACLYVHYAASHGFEDKWRKKKKEQKKKKKKCFPFPPIFIKF